MNGDNILSKAITMFHRMLKRLSPTQLIMISFMLVIIFGALFLCFPISHLPNVEVSFIDALFTSTSAVCVTGLVTLITATTWSIFGKIVILCLIQIGGLSLITLVFYFVIHLGKKVTLKNRLTIQAAYNTSNLQGMVRMVILVIRGTLIFEGIGAAILFIFFLSKDYTWQQALFYGIFHSVSAFCNAGFDIIGKQGFMPFVTSITLNFVVMTLIIVGGIGFTVWSDVIQKIKSFFFYKTKRKTKFSLHSKLALLTTLILLLLGAAYFFVNEYNNPATLGDLSLPHKMLAALFQSTTLRTAGFNTINQYGLKESSKLVSIAFMMIGGSPGGTAGGIKTITLAIITCSVWSVIKGHYSINVFGRTIPNNSLQKALTVLITMLFLLISATTVLAITEHNSIFPHTVIDLLFEVSSALGTVGLSTGITPFLSSTGKLLIVICMFVGRLGPIAIVISLTHSLEHKKPLVRYPEEEIMIG